MDRSVFEPGLRAWQDFRRTWPQLLLVTVVTRLAVLPTLALGLSLLLRLFLAGQQRGALSDDEILFFFLTPVGLGALLVVGGLWVAMSLVEQAALMTVALGASEGRRLSALGTLRWILRTFSRIFLLGGHLIVRVLAIGAPIAGLVGAVYWMFLRHHDINYYLATRPLEFLWAAGIAGVLIAALTAVLGSKLLSWLYALPILLFEGRRPRAALSGAASMARGHRPGLFGWMLAWMVSTNLTLVGVSWILGLAGRTSLAIAGNSVTSVALAMASVGLASLVADAVLSFLSAAAFALLVIRLYRSHAGRGVVPGAIEESGGWRGPQALRGTRGRILWGGSVAAAAAIAGTIVLLGSIRMEDDVLIIAHRGASLHAPENTLAAVERAIADGADQIEIDVQETADGEVVVFHDSDFMKTAGLPLRVREASIRDLETIDVGSWFDDRFVGERVPTLEAVLLAARPASAVTVNIELKYYGRERDLERRVVEIVERAGMEERVVIMSLKYDGVRKARALRPDWTFGLLTTVQLGDPTSFEVDFLAVNAASAGRGFVRRAQRRGRNVYAWTVNDPYVMSALVSRGVDGIITDDPALGRRVLRIRSEMDPAQRLLVGIGAELGVFSMPEPEVDEGDA